MELIRDWREMQKFTCGDPHGFVPTMGYLHEGHLSLVRTARYECKTVSASIFVNPSQFGPTEDLAQYPRDLERDLTLLEDEGCDIVFHPSPESMYPQGYHTWVKVEDLSEELCGNTRPGHFQGVTTIVMKLLNIMRPERMYMGEKDFQQTVVLKRMIGDLNLPVELIVCPTVREEDGLAMSSRNSYLDADDRKRALGLYHMLLMAQSLYRQGIRSGSEIRETILPLFQEYRIRPDYLSLVDPQTLKPVRDVDDDTRVVIAGWVNLTRLIDNIRLGG